MSTALRLRRPFLTVEETALVLRLPVTRVEEKLDAGELPQALRVDGGEFQPTANKRLVPYLELRKQLVGENLVSVDSWQRGDFEPDKDRSS